MAAPTRHWAPAPHPGSAPGVPRPPSPTTRRASTMAVTAVGNQFPPNSHVTFGTATTPGSYAETSFRPPAHPAPAMSEIVLNPAPHGGHGVNLPVKAMTMTHELSVHALQDHQAHVSGRTTTAVQDHRKMFLAPARSSPESFLQATRQLLTDRTLTDPDRRAMAHEFHRDTVAEITDPANRGRLSRQKMAGAETWTRNRRDSMLDAINKGFGTADHPWYR